MGGGLFRGHEGSNKSRFGEGLVKGECRGSTGRRDLERFHPCLHVQHHPRGEVVPAEIGVRGGVQQGGDEVVVR